MYNFDLLCNEGDEAYLRHQYPDIADRIVWPALRAAFEEHEERSKATKRVSRRSCFIGILLVVLSLIVTLVGTAELSRDYLQANAQLSGSLAVAAAALLVSGLLLGRGVLFSRKRDEWLSERQQAERLRQFYFQLMVAHADLICTGGERTAEAWREVRDKELGRVRKMFSGNTYTEQVKKDERLEEMFLVDANRITKIGKRQSLNRELFDQFKSYYREFRMNWQDDYVKLQFTEGAAPIPLFGSPFEREKLANAVESIATIGIVLAQIGAVLSQLIGGAASVTTEAFVLGSSILAIIIVGLHAFRDGTAVTSDLLRYRHYHSYLEYARRLYDDADQAGETTAVLQAALRVEEAAYFELREFLMEHSKPKLSL